MDQRDRKKKAELKSDSSLLTQLFIEGPFASTLLLKPPYNFETLQE